MTRPALIEDRAYWIEYANKLEQRIEELEEENQTLMAVGTIPVLQAQIAEYEKLCIRAIPSHSIKLIDELERIRGMK